MGKIGYFTDSELSSEIGLGFGFNIRVGFGYYHMGRRPYSAVPLNRGPVDTFNVFKIVLWRSKAMVFVALLMVVAQESNVFKTSLRRQMFIN